MKVLSIVVPVYNTELYIERCLDSLLYHEDMIKYLDIIIVNDGSSDDSLAIAQKYQKKYPESIKIIDKKNGGHGSTINAGIKVAKGEYFKVVDSDDWFDIDDFSTYIKRLLKEKADIVVTNCIREYLYNNSTDKFLGNSKNVFKISDISAVADKIYEDEFFFEFSMHTMTVKTNKLKAVWGDGLLEKTFYVDQQFVAKVFMGMKNYIRYDFTIYHYFLGRPEQSMGSGFFNHINDHERVLRWLLKSIDGNETPDYYKKIVSRQASLMLNTHYNAYFDQDRLSNEDKKALYRFDDFLQKNYLEIHDSSKAARLLWLRTSVIIKNPLFKLAMYYRGKK